MTVTQQGVITLLRSAITEKSLPLPAEFDLEGALETVQSHHMHALVYDGAVRCGVDKNCPVMKSCCADISWRSSKVRSRCRR